MPQVTFILEDGKELTHYVASGAVLLEVARKSNIEIAAPCSGNIMCGKCKVKLLDGKLESEMSRHISIDEYEHGYRLACLSKVKEDVKVQILDKTSSYKDKLRISDLRSEEENKIFGNGIKFINDWEVLKLSMDEPTPQDNVPDNDRLIRSIKNTLGDIPVEIPYFVMKKLSDILREDSFNINCIINKKDDCVFVYDVANAKEQSIPVGMAIDIGVSSVSSVLINLLDGSILARASAGNAQAAYGTNVVSRIKESSEIGGRKRLQTALIENTINPMISNMCDYVGIMHESIVELSVAANTTMNHLLLGFNVQNIREDPYVPAFFEMNDIVADNLNININPNAPVIISPNTGSCIGGDITAGVLASKIWAKQELSLFVNLGANREILIGNKDSLVSCASFSNNSALEGSNLSCGMRAADGAIESCSIDEETMEPSYTVIGSDRTAPIGVCGCGIIDVIAELYRCGIINSEGIFIREGKRITLDHSGMVSYIIVNKEASATGRDISISEKDIDRFLRAKGAVFAAIRILMNTLNLEPSQIANVCISGGVGTKLNVENAFKLGMFPQFPLESIKYIGNSSLMGAYEIVSSEEAKEKVKRLARTMSYVNLKSNPNYQQEFISARAIPKP